MTEFELIMAAAEVDNSSNFLGETGVALTTGYLLIAYYVGAKLTHGQTALVNSLYVCVSFMFYFVGREKAALKDYFESEALKLNPDIPYRDVMQGNEALFPFSLILTVVITTSCLAFMWRVRHPRSG